VLGGPEQSGFAGVAQRPRPGSVNRPVIRRAYGSTQQLCRIGPQPGGRLVSAVHPVPVLLAGGDPGHHARATHPETLRLDQLPPAARPGGPPLASRLEAGTAPTASAELDATANRGAAPR